MIPHSALSRMVHSWVLSRSDREKAWTFFTEALHSDIDDIQGGTTPEGIHLGAMAGTVDLMQRCYTGLDIRDQVLWLNPFLPKELSDIRLRLCYRGHWAGFTDNVSQETNNLTKPALLGEYRCKEDKEVNSKPSFLERSQGSTLNTPHFSHLASRLLYYNLTLICYQ
ncbi:glycosyl hydrolase family 65 protein [Coleofasciculus sp. G2-EDA-02]|uniref:glycosyl hydrolase family 65 protein n=1 Tax=Coleofasciculus sp. G2-EDA-02 TaxID=3069529 RepID=UPI0032FCC099